MSPADWPLAGIRLDCGAVHLRPVREDDLGPLASILPADWEHDPHAELLPGLDEGQQRRRLLHQDYWRSMGTWSPSSWSWPFVVEHEGAPVGMQTLEADDFPRLRTVDTASWLVPSTRGRGVGVAMRTAVLALAFDHLGARAAVTSARRDNAPSLGVSRRLGYVDNGVGLTDSAAGVVELVHLRLQREVWLAAGHGSRVEVTGIAEARPWFGLAAP